ncbi:unnamed protein product [Closterium sp. NIES-65]|nr:unnamed protein product [Closterium sp. NIES-65]
MTTPPSFSLPFVSLLPFHPRLSTPFILLHLPPFPLSTSPPSPSPPPPLPSLHLPPFTLSTSPPSPSPPPSSSPLFLSPATLLRSARSDQESAAHALARDTIVRMRIAHAHCVHAHVSAHAHVSVCMRIAHAHCACALCACACECVHAHVSVLHAHVSVCMRIVRMRIAHAHCVHAHVSAHAHVSVCMRIVRMRIAHAHCAHAHVSVRMRMDLYDSRVFTLTAASQLYCHAKINPPFRPTSPSTLLSLAPLFPPTGGVMTQEPLQACCACEGRGHERCERCAATGLANHWLYSPAKDGGWGPRGQ